MPMESECSLPCSISGRWYLFLSPLPDSALIAALLSLFCLFLSDSRLPLPLPCQNSCHGIYHFVYHKRVFTLTKYILKKMSIHNTGIIFHYRIKSILPMLYVNNKDKAKGSITKYYNSNVLVNI